MHPLDAAILRTLLYADVFDYAMRLHELHRYLIHHEAVSLAHLETRLKTSTRLQELLIHQDGLICLKANRNHIEKRQLRLTYMATLSAQVRRYGRWLATVPFVRMVALTGAIAVENPAKANDDLDFMMIVEPGRVWLARALSIVLVRLGRLQGVEICPNYVTASNRLQQTRCDLYIAHEIAQLAPLFDDNLYPAFWAENGWHQDWLPNSIPLSAEEPVRPYLPLKRVLEWLLGGRLGMWLERWEYRRKSHKFLQGPQPHDSSARINSDEVKGHFNDHGAAVLAAYEERLAAYGLKMTPVDEAPAQVFSQCAK
ncbi:MAG: hypothetical protein KC615_10795 [Anaerolineae bacterium]|nr:hypothetical protein [Anaerolineae bacterium]